MSKCDCTNPNELCETPANGSSLQQIPVELMYIDIEVCGRCQGTRAALYAALQEVAPIAIGLGVQFHVKETLIENAEQARQARFQLSPTIRVAGLDIAPSAEKSLCKDCGTLICEGKVDCRVWSYRDQKYNAPPKELIVESLLRAALTIPTDKTDSDDFVLPENLVGFFAAKSALVHPTTRASCC